MLAQHIRSDESVKEQNKLLEEVKASPYLKGFEPRSYALYDDRYFKPLAYLEQVGIEKIGELVQHGYPLQQIARMLDISARVLRKWVQADPDRRLEVEEARKWAADEYAHMAGEVLKEAPLMSEAITKARALADHYQWKAERFDKETFGTKVVQHKGEISAGFTYNINIGRDRYPPRTIDSTATEVDRSSLPALDKKAG